MMDWNELQDGDLLYVSFPLQRPVERFEASTEHELCINHL